MLLKYNSNEKSTTFSNGKGKAAKGSFHTSYQVNRKRVRASSWLIQASILKIIN